MASSLAYEVHHYGMDSELQRVGVWKTSETEPQSSTTWIIYIHGGAWRDFRIDHKTLMPTIDAILSSQDAGKTSIAGFASIDYRLSPHPSFPQDPEETPTQEYRKAFHPDHIHDVWSALGLLQKTYGFGSNYVLLGHSAGATLALQLLMGSTALKGAPVPSDIMRPRAIIGLEGIYDLQGLVDRHGPAYGELFEGAFGEATNWSDVSPMKYENDFKSDWKEGELVVLAWGPDDELIDEPEIRGMTKRLIEDKVRTLVFKDLKGTHDGMWEDGKPFADTILKTLSALKK